MKKWPTLLALFLLSFSAFSFETNSIPSDLRTWSDWVLKDDQQIGCPSSIHSFQERICSWPKKLEIEMGKSKGNFKGEWFLFKEGFITLPGSLETAWPVAVLVNGKTHPVTNDNGIPKIFLTKGSFNISGELSWNQAPLRLSLPEGVGFLDLTIRGNKVFNPKFDNQGGLWLKREREGESKERDYLKIKIFRKIVDSIPTTVETYLDLKVGGGERELSLPSLLLNGMIPMSAQSNLPIQWNPSGELKLRVKPGSWYVTLKSRSEKPIENLKAPTKDAPYPQEEFWVFKGENDLRVVEVSGVNQIDSQRLDLPSHFNGLPTYLMKPGVEFKVIEKSRGLSFVSSNSIELNRTLWLDFDGSFFTVQDQISGEMTKDWRLEMDEPFFLGAVTIANKNQLITTSGKGRGVEVRDGHLNLTAESRLKKQGMILPAIGWNQSFKRAEGILNIPPGWRTLALIGPDYSTGTWLSKWTLLSFFLVLIITIGVFKLKGFMWAAITFFGFVLLIHEANAPYWIWLHLLVSLALERALREKEKFSRFVRAYRGIALVVLIFISFPFAVEQIQKSLYPSLETDSYRNFYSSLDSSYSSGRGRNWVKKSKSRPKGMMKKEAVSKLADMEVEEDSYGAVGSAVMNAQAPVLERQVLQEFDANAQIQTGPGVPKWSWNTITFRWDGPVDKSQDLRLIALSPWMNRLLTVARLVLLALMIFCFLDGKNFRDQSLQDNLKGWFPKGFFIFLLALSLFQSPSIKAENFPPKDLLKELKDYLHKPHECYPRCGSVESMEVSFDENSLTLRQRVHMVKEGYLALPGSREQWLPQMISVDGGNSFQLRGDDESLLMALSKGVHNIVMKGRLSNTQQVQISVENRPALFKYNGKGWSLEGVNSQGLLTGVITLTRLTKGQGKVSELESTMLPQFVKVERIFNLGVNWQLRTIISRLTPATQAINLKVPKLPGETITGSNVVEEKDFVKVTLPKDSHRIEYSSLLKEVSPIKLKAKNGDDWIEEWQFIPGPIWRVQFFPQSEGLEKISLKSVGNRYSPLFRPWPGEVLNVQVSRPLGAKGETITLSQADLSITPGKRRSSYELDLNFKTSLGLTHTIRIPEKAELQEVKIQGRAQPLELDKGTLNIPLGVGEQKVMVKWHLAEGIGSKFNGPKVDLGLKGINLKIKMNVGKDRWIFALGGPVMGPAILFWGKLIALIILGFFLAKISWCPLNFLHWTVLFIGLTQGYNEGIFWVSGYILFLSYRREIFKNLGKTSYNVTSLMSIFGGFIAVGTLFDILRNGLLGGPKMSIEGNNSSSYVLNWFVDRYDALIPDVWLISLPTFVYQILMLFWAIWMTFTIIKWVPWLWAGLYGEGFFKPIEMKVRKPIINRKSTDDLKGKDEE